MNIAILISGTGSNMIAIHKAIKNDLLHATISIVISSNDMAEGLNYCRKNNIPAKVIALEATAISRELTNYNLDLIVLAGFMHILKEPLLSKYRNKIINIHPSLLPKYPGLDTHKKALSNKDKVHGSTVHFVNEILDGGTIVAQCLIDIDKHDDEETLANKVKQHEWQLLPRCVELLLQNKVQCDDENTIKYHFTGFINNR